MGKYQKYKKEILLSLIESIKPSSAEGWTDVANAYQIESIFIKFSIPKMSEYA